MCASLALCYVIMHTHPTFCAASDVAGAGTAQSACLAPMEAVARAHELQLIGHRALPRETPQVSSILGGMGRAIICSTDPHTTCRRCLRCKVEAIKVHCFHALAGAGRLTVRPGTRMVRIAGLPTMQ